MVKKIFIVTCVALLAMSGSSTGWAAKRVIPKPRLKPEILNPETPAPTAPTALGFPAAGFLSAWSKEVVAAERESCAARLKGLNVTFETLAPLGRASGCGAPAPLMVSHIAEVAIVPPAELTCDMTVALHGWLTSSIIPDAHQLLRKKLVKITNASAYVCRRRNNSLSGKLSEHARANALDISTLGFADGSSINVKGDWSGLNQLIGLSAQGNFLRHIRKSACIRFTTVLGPGSDASHGDHFHIDVARRKNGYRICS